jgi:D-tyrosyl-tRNA(Tyr) deacylase
MRVVVQRVQEGRVEVDGLTASQIGRGFVIFLGIRQGDTREGALFLADKCSAMRIFEDAAGKMNLALGDVDGSVLVVSQFTLYADAQKGNRPGFSLAARPEEAEPLYECFVDRLRRALGTEKVRTGVFRAMMKVSLVNDGPVTIILDSPSSI